MEFREECFVNLKNCACDRKYAKCRTKADGQDKMGFQYISISVYIIRSHARIQRGDRGSGPPLKNHKNIEFLGNTGPLSPNLLSKFANSLDPEDLRHLAKPNQGQTGIPRINHVSELPTLLRMPRKNIIELPTCGMWDQQSLRSACAYAQSDQSLC